MKALEAIVARSLPTVSCGCHLLLSRKREKTQLHTDESVGIWALVWTKSVLSLAQLSPVIGKSSKCYSLFSHSLKKRGGGRDAAWACRKSGLGHEIFTHESWLN